MKPALLVIGFQQTVLSPGDPAARSMNNAVAYVNWAIEIFRQAGQAVICVQQLCPERGLAPGCPGFDVPEGVNIIPSDIRLFNEHGNAFYRSDLDATLKRMGVDTVFLAGHCAEQSVLSTYRGAQDHGYAAILIRGALVSASHENIRFVECISDVVSVGNLKYLLAEGSAPAKNRKMHSEAT
jgi:nicotinamidase-related amidase